MKPRLARGELQVIGATTFDEYKKNIEKDSALERRFQPVQVNEPDKESCIRIINGLKSTFRSRIAASSFSLIIQCLINLIPPYKHKTTPYP